MEAQLGGYQQHNASQLDANYKSELPCPIQGNQTYKLLRMTTKIVSSNALAQDKELATEDLMDLVRICGQSEDPINPAELSLLAAFVPKTTPLMTANGVVLANGMDTESNMEDLERIGELFTISSETHRLTSFSRWFSHAEDES